MSKQHTFSFWIHGLELNFGTHLGLKKMPPSLPPPVVPRDSSSSEILSLSSVGKESPWDRRAVCWLLLLLRPLPLHSLPWLPSCPGCIFFSFPVGSAPCSGTSPSRRRRRRPSAAAAQISAWALSAATELWPRMKLHRKMWITLLPNPISWH